MIGQRASQSHRAKPGYKAKHMWSRSLLTRNNPTGHRTAQDRYREDGRKRVPSGFEPATFATNGHKRQACFRTNESPCVRQPRQDESNTDLAAENVFRLFPFIPTLHSFIQPIHSKLALIHSTHSFQTCTHSLNPFIPTLNSFLQPIHSSLTRNDGAGFSCTQNQHQ